MPGLPQRIDPFSNATTSLCSFSCGHGSVSGGTGFWSKHRDEVSNSQLQKFWSELTPQVRQELLRIDKHTFFEQARKNMYCSRCNGLLLEAYSQIVVYRKSSQQEGNRLGAQKVDDDGGLSMMTGCQEETQDPSVHPWSGLTAARDGTLTLLDGLLYSKSLKELQNVFNSAHARERECELMHPDACGGGGRGWISQGMASYGRGHGPRETCALHTARLSSDTLVDFWSALGEETRQSLLRMKEEDFIERLMYRFDSKRFCRDCRRNVIREFKELKELKRMRKEPQCTSWFCVADTAFQYEVSDDTILADWHQTFIDSIGTYKHFEWAVGTGEGKSDILEFENVGMNASVEVNGLDLGGLGACFITLRACRTDGRFTELSVKAHALKGQQCVHGRLIVGDGFVTITRGESIRRFFEHAEEAEEEEDDDSMDKDGNELDGECSRPQKHAKSPELAREFLLDAATVIFKEQVEKAFREGTARQNAHSIFVCLALKLLEERVHVACKEIITLEKQMKLLEEEEKEKREEEERKERRRAKEREKKIRRKERLKEKERVREKKSCDSDQIPTVSDIFKEDEPKNAISCRDSVSELGDIELSGPPSPDTQDELFANENTPKIQNYLNDSHDGDFFNDKEGGCAIKFTRRKLRTRQEFQPSEPSVKWPERRRFALVSENGAKSETRFQGDTFENIPACINAAILKPRRNFSYAPKFSEKPPCFHSCSCNNHHSEYRAKAELNPNPNGSTTRLVRETKSVSKLESSLYWGNKYNESCGRTKSKTIVGNTKQVWEPMEPQKKYPRSNSDSDVTLSSGIEADNHRKSSDQGNGNLVETSSNETSSNESNESPSNETSDPNTSTPSSSSSSDNCSSFLSENSSPQNLESTSSSDSESVQNGSSECHSESVQNGSSECHSESVQSGFSECQEEEQQTISSEFAKHFSGSNFSENPATNSSQNLGNGKAIPENNTQHLNMLSQPPLHIQNIHFPMFQPPTMGFYRQTPVSWPAPSFSYPNHYLYGGSLGYNLNGNSRFCMQYGSLQPIATTPVLGQIQVPMYQPISKPNPKEQTKVDEAQKERSSGGNTNTNSNTHTNSNSSFSLFHFGGPVALSNGYQSNVVQDNKSSNVADHGDGDTATCNKKETMIEEYNLFAANGIKFPILELF